MIPGMNDTPDILNLHYFKRDSYIFKLMSGRLAAEDWDLCAVTHLALLGVKIRETPFWDKAQKTLKAANLAAFFDRTEKYTKLLSWIFSSVNL